MLLLFFFHIYFVNHLNGYPDGVLTEYSMVQITDFLLLTGTGDPQVLVLNLMSDAI